VKQNDKFMLQYTKLSWSSPVSLLSESYNKYQKMSALALHGYTTATERSSNRPMIRYTEIRTVKQYLFQCCCFL